MSVAITVEGEPVPKERPRVNRHTGNVYTPAHTKAYEAAVAMTARAAKMNFGAKSRLVIELEFYCKSNLKDLDNLCKSVLDGLQKANAFKNDNQVVELHAWKHTKEDQPSRTEISVRSF